MNRKKVLFRYEMKSMIVFLIAGIVGALWILARLFTEFTILMPSMHGLNLWEYSAVGSYPSGCVFGSVLIAVLKDAVRICFVGLAVMALVQFSDLQSRTRREYLNSLPFTQSEKFCMKVFTGYGMITLCCLIVSVGVIALRLRYQPEIIKYNMLTPFFKQFMGADTMWHTARTLLLFWLILLALYSVYMAVAHLIKNSIVAALTGMAALIWPAFLVHSGVMICNFYRADMQGEVSQIHSGFDTAVEFLGKAARYARIFLGNALGYRFGEFSSELFYTGSEQYQPKGYEKLLNSSAVTISYGNMWISFLIVLGVLAGCTLLAWWINQKQDLARIHKLIPTRVGRVGINIGVSTSLGAVVVLGFVQDLGEVIFTWWGYVGVWLAISAVIYVILRAVKLWNRI